MSILKIARSPKLIAAVLLVAVILTVGGVTLGKYFYDRQVQKNAVPQDFYLTADYDDGGVYYVALSGGVVSFNVYNHNNVGGHGDAKNSVTAATISLEVTCYEIDKANNPVGAVPAPTAYSLTGGTQQKQEITMINADPGKTYQVEIKSTAPYEKEINFKICPMEEDVDSYYTVTPAASGNWLQVDLYIGSTEPNSITVNYNGLAPDNENDMMEDWTLATPSGTIPKASLTHHAHYTLIFFGDVSDYQVENKSLGTADETITLAPTTTP